MELSAAEWTPAPHGGGTSLARAGSSVSSSAGPGAVAKEPHPGLHELKTALQADWGYFWRDVEGAAERHWQRQEDLLARFAAQLAAGGAAAGSVMVTSPTAAAAHVPAAAVSVPPSRRSDVGGAAPGDGNPTLAHDAWHQAQAQVAVPHLARKHSSSNHNLDTNTEMSEPQSARGRPRSSTRRLHELSSNISRIKTNRLDHGAHGAPASEADTDTGYTGYSTPMTGMTGTPMTGSVLGFHHGRNDVLVHALAPLSATLYKVEAMLREQKRDVKEVLRTTKFSMWTTSLAANQALEGPQAASLGTAEAPRSAGERDVFEELRRQECQSTAAYASGCPPDECLDEDISESCSPLYCWMHKRFKWYFLWWESLEEPERHGRLADMVKSNRFETLCALVIVSNSVFTIYTSNYEITHLKPSDHPIVVMLEVFFLTFYIVELTLKLVVHRLHFFSNEEMNWNLFDISLVLFAIFDKIITAAMGNTSSDVTFLRAVRILKIAKILRGLRVMRFFAELRLMLNSLLGSLVSLFWSIVMLLLIFYIFGLVLVQGAAWFLIHSQSGGEVDLVEGQFDVIMDTFGSVQRSMLTLYMVATGGDDWSKFYEVTEGIGTMEAVVFLVFVALMQIALMNILTGIFVENAMKLAQPDREALALERRKKQNNDAEELKRLFIQMGAKTGILTNDEFKRQMRRSKVVAHFAVLGLDVKDANSFFETLAAASENNEVDIKTFVDGCMRLKGPATSIDLQSVAFETRVIHRCLRRLRQDCMESIQALGQRVPKLCAGEPLEQL
mmetsp:Transcript_113252/g.293125  ORF Transcript_113252/g.293125 Transcript_113252/m.293125 type:complete len:784 (-) Transcript_113252:100-2451(-)